MKKIKIAICDADLEYGSRLAQFLLDHEEKKCEVCVYTKVEILISDLELDMPDVILCTYPFCSSQLLEQIRTKETAEPILILLNDGEIEKVEDDCYVIDKYQSAEEIIRAIYRLLAAGKNMASHGYSMARQVLGVFAPGQQELSTLFAFTLAQTLSKEQRVLYISLQGCAGFSRLLGEEYEYDLADVITMLRAEQADVYTGIRGVLHRMGEVDYIPPVRNAQNAAEISSKDILALMKILGEESDYEVIILEIERVVEGIYEVLAECDCVYSPYHESRIQQCMRGQLEDNLDMGGYQELMGQIQYLKVPRINMLSLGTENFAGQLLWSELGSYVREHVTGEQSYGQGS